MKFKIKKKKIKEYHVTPYGFAHTYVIKAKNESEALKKVGSILKDQEVSKEEIAIAMQEAEVY